MVNNGLGIVPSLDGIVFKEVYREGGAAQEELNDFLISFAPRKIDYRTMIYCGVGSMLKFMWFTFGKSKLPRKMKKRIYLTKKLRKKHLPEYYGKTKAI